MNAKHKLLMLLALVHICLAAFGAAAISLGDPENIPLVEWYRHMSGADNDFAFFAPGVGAQQRVQFVLQDDEGRTWTESLRIGPNHEANLCFETVPFVLASADDRTAWNMLDSMAQTMLKRHSNATSVTIRVESFAAAWHTENPEQPVVDFPTMHEYQQGKRPEWLLMYEVTFPTQAKGQAVAGINFERDQS